MTFQPQNDGGIPTWRVANGPGGPPVPADLANIDFAVMIWCGQQMLRNTVSQRLYDMFENDIDGGYFADYYPFLPAENIPSDRFYRFEFDADGQFITCHGPYEATNDDPAPAVPLQLPAPALPAAPPAAPIAAPAQAASRRLADFAAKDALHPLPAPWWVAPRPSKNWVAAEFLLLVFEAKRGPYRAPGPPVALWTAHRLAQWGFNRSPESVESMRHKTKEWWDVLDQEASTFVGQGRDPNGIALRAPRRGLWGKAPAAGQTAADIWV